MRHPARLLGIGCNLFSAIGLRLADLRHPAGPVSVPDRAPPGPGCRRAIRPGPGRRPVSMTPASVYRQARSSVARSPHDIPKPAVSLQVNPVRRVPGTRVLVFGNVMRVSPLATRAAPRPPPTKGLNGPSGRTPKPGRSTYAARIPDSEDRPTDTDC